MKIILLAQLTLWAGLFALLLERESEIMERRTGVELDKGEIFGRRLFFGFPGVS